MEDDEIQTPISSSNCSNGGRNPPKMSPGPLGSDTKLGFPNEGDMVVMGGTNRLRQWPHSSRIIRVSRASGGKDRHSKVWTAKGPRDRRVRLSVSTAIQFYDLQDRLGYDQPSKAVEWLIKAASSAINELPSLGGLSCPPSGDSLDGGGSNQVCGSVSSNNSETSKGSGGLSLSRSEIRVKARERARERAAKEKVDEIRHQQNPGLVDSAQTPSFTQLLTAGINSLKYEENGGGNNNASVSPPWLSSASTAVTQMEYFGGVMGPGSARGSQITSGYQTGGGGVPIAQVMTFNQNHLNQHQNYAYVGDSNQMYGGSDYNLSFSISSPASTGGGHIGGGYSNNRGPLQSNNSAAAVATTPTPTPTSLLSYHLPRYASNATDGVNVPSLFLGGATAVENQHQHQHQFHHPSGLQLCYGDGNRHSDHHKGKGKNS